MIKLSNNKLSADVSTSGAELCSLVSNGRELIWQADKTFWGRHAPILFPIVGRVFNDEYRLGADSFHLTQHGFARDCEFELLSQTETECVLRLCSNDSTRKRFPFDFELTAAYRLEGSSIVCSWQVRNIGSEAMPCQIGGHPAFNYFDYPGADGRRGSALILKDGCPLERFVATRIDANGCALPEHEVVELTCGIMNLDSTTFDNGVYILEDGQCDEVCLLDNNGHEYVSLRSSGSPVFGIWAPERKDPPFMCIEPWMGRTDPDGFSGDFSEKPWINIIEPGCSLNFEYSISSGREESRFDDTVNPKVERYSALTLDLESLSSDGEHGIPSANSAGSGIAVSDAIALLANAASLIHERLGSWWTGFYLVQGEQLVLGPFQGPLACTRIPKGRGVCGSAWELDRTLVVPDVDLFPGHIACSGKSRSEIVVPVHAGGRVAGVLDIDSDKLAAFNTTDALWLEGIAALLGEAAAVLSNMK